MCYFAVCFWKSFSLQPTLTPSQWLKNCPFAMKFLSQDKLHVNDMYAKTQAQKAYTQKKLTIYQRVCPPLASITACNLVGMEWHSRRRFWPLIIFHSLRMTTLKSLAFLGHIEPCWTASFKIFQRFSIGFRSVEFGGFWITFFGWIIWIWSLVVTLTTWFQVHDKNFKVKYQFLISLEACSGQTWIFFYWETKMPFFLGPYCTSTILYLWSPTIWFLSKFSSFKEMYIFNALNDISGGALY
jgi:hypothetical protein